MLIVGDDLDTRMSGPGFKPTIQAEALEGLSRKEGAWKPSPEVEQRRRAVYMFSQRSLLPPLMTTFDFVDTTLPCVQRPVSTVAPQALALLNNSFAHERSAALAERVQREISGNSTTPLLDRHIRRVWQISLGRDPSDSDIDAARSHVQQQTERFERTMQSQPSREIKLPGNGRVLHLAADAGVQVDADGRVESWNDQSGQSHHASQPVATHRPLLVKNAIHGQPTLRLDGQKRFLKVSGQVVTSPAFAVFAVVSDLSTTNQHREIFSNWNGAAGNSGTSLFLGMTGADSIRLSDDFSGVGTIERRSTPFLLSGFSGSTGISVQQNGKERASRAQGLSPRNLKTDYVIGQQGNIDGEYWHGDIAELLVYDRQLNDAERQAVTQYLTEKYNLPRQVQERRRSSYQLALTSLCHVLMNTNEFVYLD